MQTLERRLCTARTKADEPCRAFSLSDSEYCFRHDPRLEDQRAEWVANGGRNRSNLARAEKRIPLGLQDTLGVLLQAVADVRDGSLSAARATAIASLCRAICTTYELGAFEPRMAEMERKLGERNDAL